MRLKVVPALAPGASFKAFLCALAILLALLSVFFFQSFLPGLTLFSNDGPLGRLMSECHRLPERFSGSWEDLNGLGLREGPAWPNITYGLQYCLGPIAFSKFYAPLALLFLGAAAWTFFRSFGLSPVAAVLGSLAATLNSSYFSVACWGVAAHTITVGMAFLALAALQDAASKHRWLRVALAGAAVGMGILEGADVGALFSLLVAAFLVAQTLFSGPPSVRKVSSGAAQLGLLALVAVVMSAGFVLSTMHAQGQDSAAKPPDDVAKAKNWNWATQWSLPKREALGIIVPGLFGYRMDALEGGNYWGATGRDMAWDKYFAGRAKGPLPTGYIRFSGGGSYAGVLVVLVALWATGQSLRRKDSIFNLSERKWTWFWAGSAVLFLVLAFGRYAPLYRLVYALPYFSTIRNPTKFLHLFSLCLVVLFAYGVEGLGHLQPIPAVKPRGKKTGNQKLEPQFSRFDQLFILGSILFLLMAVGGWILYGSQKNVLAQYLVLVRFPSAVAEQIADFSVRQVGWFLLLLSVTVVLFAFVVTGTLGLRRTRLAALCLGLLLVLDLGRANLPWIVYWNYPSKYASNAVLDILRDHPNEHRVAAISPGMAPDTREGQSIATLADHWYELYSIEWLQHLFSYYNIQSLDLVQMRVMPADMKAFGTTIGYDGFPGSERLQPRFWELCNNRYLLGPAAMLDILNQKFDGGQNRFKLLTRFQLVPKPGISRPVRLDDLTVAVADDGDFGLFEFAGALPRAKLFTNWQVVTNDRLSLAGLASDRFDPHHSVILNSASVAPPSPGAATDSDNAGSVTFVSYAPKDIILEAHARDRSVLLLNDRFDPEWQVLVDGQTQPLLRCNYIMRGVELAAGDHRIEFRLHDRFAAAWFASLAVTVLAVGLSGALLFRPKEAVISREPIRRALSRAPV